MFSLLRRIKNTRSKQEKGRWREGEVNRMVFGFVYRVINIWGEREVDELGNQVKTDGAAGWEVGPTRNIHA
jgi:hypothetical protein